MAKCKSQLLDAGLSGESFVNMCLFLTAGALPLKLKGRIFSSNIPSPLLHATKTWPMYIDAYYKPCQNDCAMVRWICGVEYSGEPGMEELGLEDLTIFIRRLRLK